MAEGDRHRLFVGEVDTDGRDRRRRPDLETASLVLSFVVMTTLYSLQSRSDVLAKSAFGDLPARGSRQLVEDFESFGQQFLRNTLLQKVFDEGGQVQYAGLLKLHEHAHTFAEDRVRHRDGRGHSDCGMCRDRFFDLDRADVLSAAQDEVRRAAREREVALVVQLADVTHPHPAVFGVQLVVVGAIQIAEAQRRSAAGRLPATGLGDVEVPVEQSHLHLRHDPARGAQPAVQRIGDRGRTQHAGLVGTVELQDRDAGQLLELCRLRVRQRFAASEDDPQAAQVVLPGCRISQDHRQLRADTTQHRRAVALDRRARRGGIEALNAHGGGAEADRRGVRGPDAEAVRGGDDRQKDVVAGELAVGDRLLVEVVPPILGVDNAFGHAGGARRGVDQEDVVGPGRREAGVCQAVGPRCRHRGGTLSPNVTA